MSQLNAVLAEKDDEVLLSRLREYVEHGRLNVGRAEAARDAKIRDLYRSGAKGRAELARLTGLSLSRVKQLTVGERS